MDDLLAGLWAGTAAGLLGGKPSPLLVDRLGSRLTAHLLWRYRMAVIMSVDAHLYGMFNHGGRRAMLHFDVDEFGNNSNIALFADWKVLEFKGFVP